MKRESSVRIFLRQIGLSYESCRVNFFTVPVSLWTLISKLCLREPPQGIQARCEESREQFNKVSHQLALTAPEPLSKATVVMQNYTAEFLVLHKSNDENKLDELGEKYKAAKANFMTEARKVLGAQLIEA